MRSGRQGLVHDRQPKPRRRFRAGRLLAALHDVSEALQRVNDPEVAAWVALTGLTAGEGFGFNRAFLLLAKGNGTEGFFGVGPRTREEAGVVWTEMHRLGIRATASLTSPDPALLQVERAKHATTLELLSHPLLQPCESWTRPFVGRTGHPHPCVRRWIEVLDSPALAVIPVMTEDRPQGVVIADNFVTRGAIYPGTLEAAATVVTALGIALERTYLLESLQEEQRRRIAAEHANTLLEAARTLAHDLKNPLAIAGGLAREVAASTPRSREALRKRLNTIAGAVTSAEERLARLVEGLTQRVDGVKLEGVEIGALVERVVGAFRPLAASRDLKIFCYRPAKDMIARAEPSFVERCVENLVGNALQVLRSSLVPSATVRVATFAAGPEIRIEVSDNGPPIPAAMRGDPFSGVLTTRRSGTGLGLVSVRRLADAMGGRVEYDEQDPGWVRFTVILRRFS